LTLYVYPNTTLNLPTIQTTIVLKKGALTLGLIGIGLASPSIAVLLLPPKSEAPSNSLSRRLNRLNR